MLDRAKLTKKFLSQNKNSVTSQFSERVKKAEDRIIESLNSSAYYLDPKSYRATSVAQDSNRNVNTSVDSIKSGSQSLLGVILNDGHEYNSIEAEDLSFQMTEGVKSIKIDGQTS